MTTAKDRGVVVFSGPYSLAPEESSFLFAEPHYSWRYGLYVIAWPRGGRYYPHYIGMTTGRIVDRVDEYLRGFLSGRLPLYNRFYLDAACDKRKGETVNGHVKFIYGPPSPVSFAGEFLARLEAGMAGEITSYLQHLRFFLAPVEWADREELLDIEAVLIERARAGEARHIMDSPLTRHEVDDRFRRLLSVKVQDPKGELVDLQEPLIGVEEYRNRPVKGSEPLDPE